MFVKTLNGQEYFDESQQEVMNWGINDSIKNVMQRNPAFTGVNKGQVVFTNCVTREDKEVNAMISFEYSYENGKTNYFKLVEIAIFDNDDNDGINYMLEHRATEDSLEAPLDPIDNYLSKLIAFSYKESDGVNWKMAVADILSEFQDLGEDTISGNEALKMINNLLKNKYGTEY